MPIGRSARRGMVAGAMINSSRTKKQAAAQATPSAQSPVAQPAQDQSALTKQLVELKGLVDQGILTQAEFDAKKKQLLNI